MRYNKYIMLAFRIFTVLLGVSYIGFGIYCAVTAKTFDLTLIAGVGICFFMASLLFLGSKEIRANIS